MSRRPTSHPGSREPDALEREEGISCSGAILAGGKSRRFGQDKAQALLGGKPLALHVFETMQTLFEDVLIVTQQPLDFESFHGTVVSDIVRGAGALGGLLTALVHAKAERCFVVGCDMPFLNAAVIRKVLEKSAGHDVVVPVLGGELQPLHAVYSKRCISHIQDRIAVGAFRIFDFYPKVSTLRLEERFWEAIDPQNRSFANINTREEWLRAERMWADGR